MDTKMAITEIVTLLVAISGLVTAVLAHRKNAVEADKITEEITDMVLQRAKLELDELRNCITDLEVENTALRNQIRELNKKIERQAYRIRELEKENREYKAENTKLRERVVKLEKGTGPLSEP